MFVTLLLFRCQPGEKDSACLRNGHQFVLTQGRVKFVQDPHTATPNSAESSRDIEAGLSPFSFMSLVKTIGNGHNSIA